MVGEKMTRLELGKSQDSGEEWLLSQFSNFRACKTQLKGILKIRFPGSTPWGWFCNSGASTVQTTLWEPVAKGWKNALEQEKRKCSYKVGFYGNNPSCLPRIDLNVQREYDPWKASHTD